MSDGVRIISKNHRGSQAGKTVQRGKEEREEEGRHMVEGAEWILSTLLVVEEGGGEVGFGRVR